MNNTPKKKARMGVLLSGTGRTLDNFFQKIDSRELPVEIAVVISSHDGVAGIEKAKRRNIPTILVDFKKIPEPQFSDSINEALRKHRAEFVAMAGFIRYWKVPEDFAGKVLNIHPALLPEFGGRGMYGIRVHEAVLKAKSKETGCTVHLVDDQYDHGKILLQRKVKIEFEDTPETIAHKVFDQECIAYPEAIVQYLSKR